MIQCTRIADIDHGVPSFWKISSNVLNATGFTRLKFILSWCGLEKMSKVTYYPSTPASNARLLSSTEDIPVSARILALTLSWVKLLLYSIFLISEVAPTPIDDFSSHSSD